MFIRLLFHRPAGGDSVVPSDQQSRMAPMVSKCSNPHCSAPFLYLHTGKLFRFDLPNGQAGSDWDAPMPLKRVQFFWLCKACVTKFTFVADAAVGARVVTLQARAAAAS